MNQEKFCSELIKIAFAAMACDGEIVDAEIKKLKEIEKADFYLKDFDLGSLLDDLMLSFPALKMNLVDKIVAGIYFLDFNEVQRMIVMEKAIEIIKADKKIKEPEIDFVNKLQVNLQISDSIMSVRFQNWEVID